MDFFNGHDLLMYNLLILWMTYFINWFSWKTRCRQYLVHSHFSQMKKAALATQCVWRGRLARRKLRKLKMVICDVLHVKTSLMLFFLLLLLFLSFLICINRQQKRPELYKLQRINWRSKLKNLLGDCNRRGEWEYIYFTLLFFIFLRLFTEHKLMVCIVLYRIDSVCLHFCAF